MLKSPLREIYLLHTLRASIQKLKLKPVSHWNMISVLSLTQGRTTVEILKELFCVTSSPRSRLGSGRKTNLFHHGF